MIVLTAEMRAAAARRMGVDDLDPQTEGALLDVLALVERDNDVKPKAAPVEHRMTSAGVWWNHYMSAFSVACTCGAEFGDGDQRGAKWRLLDHVEAQDGAP